MVSARRVLSTQRAGTTLLIDSWYGPRLLHPRLLLAPYGKIGEDWYRDPAFRASLENRPPREHAAWNVIPFPQGMPVPDRAQLQSVGVDLVILSNLVRRREPAAAAWEQLIQEGVLQAIPPEEGGGVQFYRVAKTP